MTTPLSSRLPPHYAGLTDFNVGSDASGSSLSCVSSVCGSSGRSESSARRGPCSLVSRLRCGRPGGDAASGLGTSSPARPTEHLSSAQPEPPFGGR